MDTQSLKIDLIQWLAQLQDEKILQKVQAIKEEDEIELSSEHQKELDKRLEKYERGEMKFKSWEETKENIRKRYKNTQ